MDSFSHTFSICAYKESEYLEECILSLRAQTLPTHILMVTSTPNAHIRGLAEKYDIPLFLREGASDIRDDWNFAYDTPTTQWVTVAHQDDAYHPDYAKRMAQRVADFSHPIAFVSDYLPIKNGQVGERDINSRLRRLLRSPIKNDRRAGSPFWKRQILAFGNCICAPAVTYNKEVLGPSFFTSEYKFNIDWDTFLKFASIEGQLAYVDEPLTYYRVHSGATSKEFIENHLRERDDEAMFLKFHPKWMVKCIMVFYKKAYDTYN